MSANEAPMNANLQRDLELFGQALELTDPAARASFLDRACGANVPLRQRIETLLHAHQLAGTFLEEPPTSAPTMVAPPGDFAAAEQAGDRIGRYKLLQQIGEGGCGIVYMAEQEEPVRRRVALKVIKLGMDTKSVIARFEAERQALALMDHPNIAKVLDAGATDSGRPYFVMELVRGVRLTDYCDEAKLSMPERLQLFIQVCHAIQHAHQKGIIHRDIKPSNILVTVNDGVPVPKVIDFGIAKATNQQQLTDKTLFTAFEQFIGTPAYMSPEQAVMTSLDIDTRSDIYALGVLLYELITGHTPFDAQQLMKAGLDEIRRTIREVEPPRPSTRLSTMLQADLTTVAQRRHAEPAKLATQIRGDLDWIVMKALEKDRTRRYETATGLAADIQRHLSNEPVAARPPSPTYRFQKMIRRNKGAAMAATAITLTLLAAVIFSAAAFVRERKARLAAAEAERAKEEVRKKAEGETVRADTAALFITRFLESTVPELYQQGQTKAIKQMTDTADRLASTLAKSPLAEAKLRYIIADTYDEPLFESSDAVREYELVQKLAEQSGTEGRRLAELAGVRALVNRLWNFAEDPKKADEIVRELVRIGDDALRATPVDLEKAALTLGVAAEYKGYFGDRHEAEYLTRANVRAIEENPLIQATPTALYYSRFLLVNLADALGQDAEAEAQANKLFDLFKSGRLGNTDDSERELVNFLHTMWILDSTRLPVSSLKKLLDGIEPENRSLRALVQGRLGIALGRSGDWTNGLAMLRTANQETHGSTELWNAQICLESLLGNPQTIESLLVEGLANFAGGSDFERARLLLEPLILFSRRPEYARTIRNLLSRTQQAPPWAESLKTRPLALFQYRTGDYGGASNTLRRLMQERRTLSTPERLAWTAFTLAAVEAKQGKMTEARAAYYKGVQAHSPALRNAGQKYTGDRWDIAASAELLRREAAALLGDSVPSDPPAPGQP